MTVEQFNPYGFDGVWRMDLEQSTVRDPKTGEWQKEWLSGQINEIRHAGTTQYFRIRVDIAPGLSVYQAFTQHFDATDWAPYSVLHVEGDPEHELLSGNGVLKDGMRAKAPAAWVKLIYVDPWTQYRVTRNPDGTPQYLLLRRLSEDGQRLTGTVLTPDGEATISKTFVRDPEAAFIIPEARAVPR